MIDCEPHHKSPHHKSPQVSACITMFGKQNGINGRVTKTQKEMGVCTWN